MPDPSSGGVQCAVVEAYKRFAVGGVVRLPRLPLRLPVRLPDGSLCTKSGRLQPNCDMERLLVKTASIGSHGRQ